MMNTTINRQTMLSKMTKDQAGIVMRDSKHLIRAKNTAGQFEADKMKLHRLSKRKANEKTLL